MKKYKLAKTGEYVKIGDFVTSTYKKKCSFGFIEAVQTVLVTKDNVAELVKNKTLIEEDNSPKFSIPIDLDFYLSRIGKKMKIDKENVVILLDSLNLAGYSQAVLNILLSEVNHVINSGSKGLEIPLVKYYINYDNGEIYWAQGPAPKKLVWFYSKEDAELAKKILKEQFDFMFTNNGK